MQVASYADALWARHAIFLPHGGGILRDEPKERLRRRLRVGRTEQISRHYLALRRML